MHFCVLLITNIIDFFTVLQKKERVIILFTTLSYCFSDSC